jgi:Uma2 family endonuclease
MFFPSACRTKKLERRLAAGFQRDFWGKAECNFALRSLRDPVQLFCPAFFPSVGGHSALADKADEAIIYSMMNAVESSPIPLRGAQIWPLSVAAYRVLGEAGLIPKNTELLYGFVYTKMSKSPLHSALVRRLARLLNKVLPAGYFVDKEQPIACEDSEPEPDISVVHGSEDDFWHQHPHTSEFVIEISITSHDYDRSKLRAYAAAGVKECWLVLGPEKQIEVYRQPKNGQFADQSVHGPGGIITSTSLPEFTLSLDAFFTK